MGIPSIVMPACYGGLGLALRGSVPSWKKWDAHWPPHPVRHSRAEASALELAGASHQQDLLPDIIAGKLTLALAVDENHHHNPWLPRLP